jgi:putative CocE/NonD family hydrolase
MMEEKHEVRIDFGVRVAMRDGVELSTDIYHPVETQTGTRFPAILVRTPYNKASVKNVETARWFAEHGFVYVFMDVRGRGDSDGEFFPYRNEAKDGYDSIEWCAAQPWCDGKIGTAGGSYLGHSQWLTALLRPPHLACMIARVSPSDPFVEWPTGTHGPIHLCWLHLTSGRLNQVMEAVDWEKVYTHLPLESMDVQAGRVSAIWREELRHTRLDEFWEPLRYQNQLHKVEVPVLHISGWYDDEQIGTPLNFQGMTSQAASQHARQNQKLLMGPWGHALNTTSKLGEVEFGPQALIDLRGVELSWMQRWLKGFQPAEKESPVRIFIMGENCWRDEQEWPLARTLWTHYFLHSQGGANSRFGDGWLSTQPAGEEKPDHFRYDPARPVPFLTEPTSSQIGGPDDYAAVERRDDILVYVTPPLDADIEVTGPVKLELFAASSAVDTDFTAKLVDVHPSGFVQRLCDGIVRARFRDSLENPSLIEPGQIYRFDIDLWNTCQVFFKGHRIGLEVSSSAFPKFERNLNTGEDLATGTRMLAADQTVYHDTAHPSALVLPIIPR